jgi:hypothetical protein
LTADLVARLRQTPMDGASDDAVASLHDLLWQALEALYPEAAAHYRTSRALATQA